ncbi:helix-turn-helix domain-containing protein [Clostridium omnivorum]|uniref:HTH cro/C1-type domain-containing protein n=1 Tax=Clostridium omnivorum TaxID=1604902 RepID=A0ABQ5NCX6_9CLOT|nr:helix-turn-helix transcriptional regulator [Clostridium sp. E14]GLC32887.1 hypothetical protein bsdE14_42970 [Clostridium sp. E14]
MNYKIGSKLRELREKNGKSQEDIAKYFGFSSKNSIGKWERNESEPKYEHLVELAKLYNVSVGYFFEESIENDSITLPAELQDKILDKILDDLEYEDILKSDISEDTKIRLKKSLQRYANNLVNKKEDL